MRKHKGLRFVLQHHELWWNPISTTEAGHYAAWKLARGNAEVSFTPESSVITSEQWARNRNCKFSLPFSSAQVGFPVVGAELVGVLFGRGNPSPNPLGLCTAWTGSEIPLPSRPRPEPGVQPILWSMRFPMLLSRIGWAFSPTIPEMKIWEPTGEDLPRAEKNSSPRAFVSSLTTQASCRVCCLPYREPQARWLMDVKVLENWKHTTTRWVFTASWAVVKTQIILQYLSFALDPGGNKTKPNQNVTCCNMNS